MTALLAVPSNAEVAIYTDSQAAIDRINRILDAAYRINRRKFLKMNNYIILFTIYDLIKMKSLTFNLHKVRGHSGNRWNDMADEIAKQGREAASCNNDRIVDIRLLYSFSFPLTFLPVWYNISIDRHIRSFTRLVADSLEEVQCLNKGHCLSFSTNDKFIHFIKCSNNLLPTIDNLRKRNNLYNQVRCLMCLHDDEDIQHIVICPGHEDGFQQVELEVTSKIMKFIKKSASSTKIVQGQLECIIFEYKDEAFPLLKECNHIELTRGLISDIIITKL
ncbi:hypothetical protein C1646_771105 [Rhizophagus diaphanus]|nr:hypothetical protein C1646_771105 [Rhizophagus diaphanus] [Rhizophagus sp. MUCL 43196]